MCAAVIPARRLLSLLPPDEKCRSLEKGFGLNEQGLARALQRRRDCSSGGYFLQRPLPPPPPPPPSLPPRYKAEVNRSCHSPEFSSRADLCSRVFPFSHQTADTHTHTHTDCSSDLQPVFLIPSRRVFTFFYNSPFPFGPVWILRTSSPSLDLRRFLPWTLRADMARLFLLCLLLFVSAQTVSRTDSTLTGVHIIYLLFIIQQRWFVFFAGFWERGGLETCAFTRSAHSFSPSFTSFLRDRNYFNTYSFDLTYLWICY